jgi:DNA-binding NarL/FixJ family response regulator/quercetin dioxygenase-like cupin family protein
VKNSDKQIRVVIADDVPEMLDAVAKRLSPEYEVVGRVSDGAALVECVLKLTPDLIVTDISMPKLTGIEALSCLRQLGVQIPAVILTVHEDEDLVKDALSLGVQGFVLKRRLVSDLPLAAHEALNGRTFVSDAIHKKVQLNSATAGDGDTTTTVDRLSPEILLDRSGLLIARTERMEWRATGMPGCQRRILFVDEQQKSLTSVVQMRAGTHFPAHRHAGPEEVFILSGDLVVEGQTLKPGDYCRAETSTVHAESYTKSGCVFVLKASQEDEIVRDSLI